MLNHSIHNDASEFCTASYPTHGKDSQRLSAASELTGNQRDKGHTAGSVRLAQPAATP